MHEATDGIPVQECLLTTEGRESGSEEVDHEITCNETDKLARYKNIFIEYHLSVRLKQGN